MFTCVQHTLQQARGRQFQLLPKVHDELSTWRQLVQELASQMTHLRELDPFPLTWEGATDASGNSMGGVCQAPDGQWFVWHPPVSTKIQAQLFTDTNPKGDVTINDLELTALFAQVQLFAPNVYTLSHIRTAVDNISAQVWANRRSVSTAIAVDPILRDLALLTRIHKIHSSMRRISGTDNKMTDAASRLTHLTDKIFLRHFALTFPQKKPRRLLTLTSGCRRQMTSMLHSKHCHMAFPPQSSRKTEPPGANGTSYANAWKSQTNSKLSEIPPPSSRFSPLVSLYQLCRIPYEIAY